MKEYFQTQIDTLREILQLSGPGQNYGDSIILWEKLFEMIISLAPVDCFNSLLGKTNSSRLLLTKMLEEEIFLHPEIDLEVEPKYLVKSLAKKEIYDEKTLESKTYSILLVKALITFLYYFDQEYGSAFFGFRWILQFIHECRKSPSCMNFQFMLTLDYERSLSLLCARALVYDFNSGRMVKNIAGTEIKVNRLDILEGLLTNILDCTEPSILGCIDELDCYMLDQLFSVIGEIEEAISILDGSILEFEHYPGNNDFGVRPTRSHVDSMIRKYILASTLKLEGDGSILYCMDKILTGLILYGGIHLEPISFFYNLRLYYKKMLPDTFVQNNFVEELSNNCLDLVERIIKESKTLRSTTHAFYLQCPQILVKIPSGNIIMVDEVYEESQHEHSHELSMFLSSLKLRAKKKLYGASRVYEEYSQHQWILAVGWIAYWQNCFLDNQGALPAELESLVSEVVTHTSDLNVKVALSRQK